MLYIAIGIAIILLITVIRRIAQQSAARRAEAEKQARMRELQEKLKRETEERQKKLKREQEERQERLKREEEERQAAERRKQAEKEAAIRDAVAKTPGSEAYIASNMESNFTGHILNIGTFTPISKKQFVAFDLETTGLSEHDDEIIEIGAVRVVNGEIVEEFSQLINPGCPVPTAASNVNHITDDMLQDKPKIYEVLPSFLSFVGNDVLAAHNAAFDAKFLAQACMKNKFKAPTEFFDTMLLSRYYPKAQNRKLVTLIACAGIENDEAHRALGDARAVAKLIIHTNEIRKRKAII